MSRTEAYVYEHQGLLGPMSAQVTRVDILSALLWAAALQMSLAPEGPNSVRPGPLPARGTTMYELLPRVSFLENLRRHLPALSSCSGNLIRYTEGWRLPRSLPLPPAGTQMTEHVPLLAQVAVHLRR